MGVLTPNEQNGTLRYDSLWTVSQDSLPGANVAKLGVIAPLP
jgi:hypothetical protein